MADIDIGSVGLGGIVTDLDPYNLPAHVWSDGLNIEFDRRGVRPQAQEKEILGPLQGNPLGIFPVLLTTSNQAWIYATTDKIFSVVDLTHTDITRSVGGAYSASDIVKWNGGILNTIPVLNNSFDVPQQIDPTDLAAPAQDLANWPATLRTLVLRPFKNFLIAIGASDTGITNQSRTLVWSDPADPGAVPPSWDWASTTTQAGVKTFSESDGLLVDGRTLRDQFIVYKNDSVWSMRFIGGTFVMSFKPLFEDVGLLNEGALAVFDKYHLFLSKRDVILHDGITMKSVADDRVRERIFTEMNASAIDNVKCQHEIGKNRVWIFYPSGTSSWADRAAIWNYREDTWTFREVPQIVAASQGFFDLDLGDVWDVQNLSWDSYDTADYWDGSIYAATSTNIIMVSQVGAATYDAGTDTSTDGLVTWTGNSTYPPAWFVDNNGPRMNGYIQRLGISLVGQDHTGQPTVKRQIEKLVSEIWPEVAFGSVQIRIGTQATPQAVPVWTDYVLFDNSVDEKADFFESAKFLAIEFKSTDANDDWTLAGYTVSIEQGSRY